MKNRFTGKIKNLLILLNFLPLALAQAAPNETIAVQAGELPAPAQIQRI